MTRLRSSLPTFQSTQWRRIISSGAESMGIPVSDAQLAQVVKFAQILMEWNRRFNLTAITDPREVAVKHFLDSMATLPYIPETGQLLDIGSGGGFPGLVLSIFRPSLSITSIDSVRKKISFQQHVIRILGLSLTRALHTRAETLSGEKEQYDIIVSRALGSLDLFTILGLPILSENGIMIAYKGGIDDETKNALESFKSQNTNLSIESHNYLLPSSGDQRSLVFIKRCY